jgi:hypothetical protein
MTKQYDSFPKQPVTIPDFVQKQTSHWRNSMTRLDGTKTASVIDFKSNQIDDEAEDDVLETLCCRLSFAAWDIFNSTQAARRKALHLFRRADRVTRFSWFRVSLLLSVSQPAATTNPNVENRIKQLAHTIWRQQRRRRCHKPMIVC